MTPLYAYSLLPVLAVALLNFFTAALRARSAMGLALYCLSVAVWCGALLLSAMPATAPVGQRLAASGAFIAASYLHAAYDLANEKSYLLVGLAYLVALGLTVLGALVPGVLYDPTTLARGPMFWPAMALAIVAAMIPLVRLARAYRRAEPDRKGLMRWLFIAGILCYAGGMSNAVLLAHGRALPFGMLLVFASLLVLSGVVREHQPSSERRLLERSMLYSALAAFLSAGYLFGVLTLMTEQPLVREYRLGAFFLLSMAALAFEPLRQQIQETVARRFLRHRTDAVQLAEMLRVQEEKAERAERLAELGTLASAVAHEVRNPLGVLAAHLKLLSRSGADADTVRAMEEQIARAGRFVDDLLRYGRPRPLELRMIDLAATVDLALTTAAQGLGTSLDGISVKRELGRAGLVEADQAQLSQMFVILFENALLALDEANGRRDICVSAYTERGQVLVTVEDSGPGISPEIIPRLFEPFVTGRKREGRRAGTGLGLATARRILERHAGKIRADRSAELGGARFVVELPIHQSVLVSKEERT
jgi:signal transduction histidine kinase